MTRLSCFKIIAFGLSVCGVPCPSGWVRAAEIVHVLDERASTTDAPTAIMAKFVVNSENRELGRAWVEVEADGGYSDPDQDREEVFLKKAVPGLKFIPRTNEVVYQPKDAAQPVVCGHFSEGGWLKVDAVHPTGNCKFLVKTEKRPYDDGYHVRQKPYVVVDLSI